MRLANGYIWQIALRRKLARHFIVRHMRVRDHLLLLLDLIGTALFAAEGATAGVHVRLDLLGVLVVAFLTALGGGIVRDILLGATPPNAMRDWRYVATALTAGLIVFTLRTSIAASGEGWVQVLDAAGLSLFAVAGATKAIEYGIHPLMATMLGGLTAVGGGTLRDILINQIPNVLKADVYAAAALLGAAITVTLRKVGIKPPMADVAGIVCCFATRMAAVHFHWNLPIAG
ncbi:Uncharacterized membrane protein YeiH [Terriglobus roseus]|uniref:Uncharacterized membrane protein YeiH n=2 Tax=Terriglobus roseus TaxID=392734 RepID=A0A1G7NHX2_9BACT|nr:Uncharacterized membrane protein YeiH [Terriglobus roseus]